MPQPIPRGYHAVTPSFTFKDSKRAIEFYKKAFDAELLDILPALKWEGTMHAALQIGDSIIMMGDEMGGSDCSRSAETAGGSPISLYLYVSDADASMKRAVEAGGRETMPISDAFWGDRVGQIRDPFGYSWMIATHRQDLTAEQIRKGAEAFFAKFQKE